MGKRKDDVNQQSVEVSEPASGSVSEATKDKDVVLEEKVVEVVEQHTEDPAAKHEDIETKKEVHSCGECKWYSHGEEREFKRFGVKDGLIEIRAVCRSPTSKARNHLVMRDSTKHQECLELGTYVAPVKEKKEQPAETKQTSAPETKTKISKKHKHNGTERAVAINGLSGDTKVLQTTKGTNKVVVKDVGEA